MSDEREYDDIREDLHAMRAQPRPEYARELDRRAAEWLRERPRRRRLPSLRIAIPAAAAAATAAVVVALAVSGGDGGGGADQLEVAVVAEGATGGGTQGVPGSGTGGAAAPEAFGAPLEQREGTDDQPDDQTDTSGGAFLLPEVEGDTVTVRYVFPAATEATVELAGHEAEVAVGPGPGSLEISTEGLPAGSHDLTISTPLAPTFRTPVEIEG